MGDELHRSRFVGAHRDEDVQISRWRVPGDALGPFRQFQTGAGKDVAKPRVFPLAWVMKAVKVEMPYLEPRQFVGFDHGVGGALDASRHAQRLQQVPHQRGFAAAQLAVQLHTGLAQSGLRAQASGKSAGVGLAAPGQVQRARWGFYNRGVRQSHIPIHKVSEPVALSLATLQDWAREAGFSQIGVAGVDLSSAEPGLRAWLAQGFHGDMAYMAAHGLKRARPAELVPGTVSVITARMDYLPAQCDEQWVQRELDRLLQPQQGVVSVYARGRDYHKVLRQRLQRLSERIAQHVGPLGYRVFTDSAPVLEAELAARSGLGWRGKHTLLLNRAAGSMFFLGEIFVDLALAPSEAEPGHCGTCTACMEVCPTRAIVAPNQLDARRCISYLTIEHAGAIPVPLRAAMGNRIYGCDDCQLVCPWNKFSVRSPLPDFDERAGLTGQSLARLLSWSESEFLHRTEGSPIRRIGYERWQRNVAVAVGNALRHPQLGAQERQALLAVAQPLLPTVSALVREHLQWALARQE